MHRGLKLFQTTITGAVCRMSLWYNKSMRRLGQKRGFTLVELSLSIAFISILSITIALIINNAISTYRRGVTLNQVNTVGMELVDDMRAAIQNSPARSVVKECELNYSSSACENDELIRSFVVKKELTDIDGVGENIPIYGAFCTGAYSYIWNSGYFYAEDEPLKNVSKAELKYMGSDGVVLMNNFRLLKIKDRERAVCVLSEGSQFDISGGTAISDEPEILLADDKNNPLALYDLDAMVPATNASGTASYYSVSFILGTVQGGINIMSSGNFCKTPEDDNSSFDYCAINKFNFAVQAIGG